MQKRVRSRTVMLTSARDNQLAVAAAYLDLTVEDFIGAAILASVLELASRDSTLAHMLGHCSGMSWDELEGEEADVMRYLRDSK